MASSSSASATPGVATNLVPSTSAASRLRRPAMVSFRSSSEPNNRPIPLLPSSKHGGSGHEASLVSILPTRSLYKALPTPASARCSYPQNVDLPREYRTGQKKPFPVPILEMLRGERARIKSAKGRLRRPASPPRNGLLVPSLVPVAYEVLNARASLIANLKRLLRVLPVQTCKYCNEVHVGPVGHPFRSCMGPKCETRRGMHRWTAASPEDIFVPVESFHLFDRLHGRITHPERLSIPRVPALVELCVQAGADLPGLPAKRRWKAVVFVGKDMVADTDDDDEVASGVDRSALVAFHDDADALPPQGATETARLCEETLRLWEAVRQGAARMMMKYPVRVCGYCPEVHVGPGGHRARNCGAFKHQQRNGQHGWQKAVVDDLVPPRYVWHLPAVSGAAATTTTPPELMRELRGFYGKAPAVVELCVQGGAEVPEEYKPTMRLDVGIPSDTTEAAMVV